MKNKNIYFVGYYHGIGNKKKFTKLFDCKNKYFLENDMKYANVNEMTTYYPALLYKYAGKRKIKNIKIDSEYKSLYRRDYKNLLSAKQIRGKSLQKDKLLFVRFIIHKYISKYKNMSKFNPINLLSFLTNIKTQIQQHNPNLIHSLAEYSSSRFRSFLILTAVSFEDFV